VRVLPQGAAEILASAPTIDDRIAAIAVRSIAANDSLEIRRPDGRQFTALVKGTATPTDPSTAAN
jgi:hypothetical protein